MHIVLFLFIGAIIVIMLAKTSGAFTAVSCVTLLLLVHWMGELIGREIPLPKSIEEKASKVLKQKENKEVK